MYQSSHDTDTYLFLYTTHLVNFDSCKKYLLILRSDFFYTTHLVNFDSCKKYLLILRSDFLL